MVKLRGREVSCFSVKALELLHSRQRVNSRAFLRTSLTLLDSILKGGIPVSTITEVGPLRFSLQCEPVTTLVILRFY